MGRESNWEDRPFFLLLLGLVDVTTSSALSSADCEWVDMGELGDIHFFGSFFGAGVDLAVTFKVVDLELLEI